MPYLSWSDGEQLQRCVLEGETLLGRDAVACTAARPQDPGVSRKHASIFEQGGHWWVRDLESSNGTLLNGLPVTLPQGHRLEDGDDLRLGDWELRFTRDFPGLDGENFIEGVGDLFEELRPEPSQSMVLLRGLQLMQRATESMLQEGSATDIARSLLSEAVRLLGADRGMVVMAHAQGGWRSLHRIGDVEDQVGLSQSVLGYVQRRLTGVMSNAPLMDPRFGGASLVELHRGALMCAPMMVDGALQGMVYLDRAREGRPFSRFDLALFQAFVRQGSVAYRHMQLAQKALGQAEVQGEYLRLKGLHDRLVARSGEILGAMQTSLRWLQSYGERAHGDHAEVLRHQVDRLLGLVETGIQETLLEVPRETSRTGRLEELHAALEPHWSALLRVRGAGFRLEPLPAGQVWLSGGMAIQAVMGIVEPLLMRVGEGATVTGQWQREGTKWVLRLGFPQSLHGPAPDAWTLRALRESGVEWRWSESTLSLSFPQGLEDTPQESLLPLLGLVTVEYELMNLFESVAEAGQLAIYPLEPEPPTTRLPSFRYLVIDAHGMGDPISCIQAFRRHPSFATVPILVVRAPEDYFESLLASGATDLLPEGFRWEALHHRLQVLKGHDELQRKALAAERLDSVRQMAGTLKHEINNPLAVISMQVELLQRKYPEEPKLGKIGEMVERIRGLMQVLQKMREAPKEEYPGGTTIAKLS